MSPRSPYVGISTNLVERIIKKIRNAKTSATLMIEIEGAGQFELPAPLPPNQQGLDESYGMQDTSCFRLEVADTSCVLVPFSYIMCC